MIATAIVPGRLYLVRWHGGMRFAFATHPCQAIEIAAEEALPCAN